MQDVFGLMVFHGAKPVAKSMESCAFEPGILYFVGDFVALPHEACDSLP